MMNKNELMKKHLNQLKIQMEQGQSLVELITLCYFAYKNKTDHEAYKDMSFKDYNQFRTTALQTSLHVSSMESELLKDMVVRGFLKTGSESQIVYEQLCELEETEIMDVMDTAVYQRNTGVQDITTPRSVAELMVTLSGYSLNGSIVNLCSGEGTILTEVVRRQHHGEVEGVEIDLLSTMISRMRMNILETDCRIWHEDLLKTKLNRQYSTVFCHYPWGSKYAGDIAMDHVGCMDYSTVRRGRMDWAFIIKAVNALRPSGKGFVLVPNGILSSSVDMEVKQTMILNGYINKVIELPSVLIPGSSSGISLLVLSDKNTQVDFINATQCLVKGGRGKELDVQAVLDIISSDYSSHKLTVSAEVIAEHGFNLQYREFRAKPDETGLINPTPLKEVAEVITGYQYTSETLTELDGKGNLKIVKMGNLDDNGITGELSGCDLDESRVEKYILRKNDILMQTKGSSSKMALLDEQEEKRIPHSNLTILRCREDKILPEYLYLFLKGGLGEQKLNSLRKGVMRMSNISKGDLEEMKIPAVDMDSQKFMILRYRELTELRLEAEARLNDICRKINDLVLDEMDRE